MELNEILTKDQLNQVNELNKKVKTLRNNIKLSQKEFIEKTYKALNYEPERILNIVHDLGLAINENK